MTIRVGDVPVAPLLDGFLDLDGKEAAVGVPTALLAEASPGLLGSAGRIRLPVICHLVRSSGRTILVDTGLGRRLRPGWPVGELDRRLLEHGVHPEDVEIVLNTHLHADHVGWNTRDDGGSARCPFFPNARYVFQRAEWQFWMGSRRAQAGYEYLGTHVADLDGRADIELAEMDAAITRELSFVSTPGHTPGHVAIGIASRGDRALIVGDVTHYIGQLDHPDWSPAWDLDPLEAARTRARVFASLENDDSATLFTSHWGFPGAGRVVRVRSRRLFEGVAWRT